MYYEQRVIDGRLMYRTEPGGEWFPVGPAEAAAIYRERDALRAEVEALRVALGRLAAIAYEGWADD